MASVVRSPPVMSQEHRSHSGHNDLRVAIATAAALTWPPPNWLILKDELEALLKSGERVVPVINLFL